MAEWDSKQDEQFMKMAFEEALKAFELDEVPVGAVVVSKGRIIARAHNLTERLNDVTAHAEMQAITSAADFLGGKYLNDCIMYVTLEPCSMCAGALNHAHLGRLVYAAPDAKRGFTLFSQSLLHPKTEVLQGTHQQESSELLREFFKKKRKA